MKIELVKKVVEAKDTMSFFWKAQKPFKYLPGQFFYVTLSNLDVADSKGTTRHFSFSTSPTEGNVFSFTTRIRNESGFKQTLKNLEIGTFAEFSGPEGTFIIDENEAGNNFLIAGGIGITPFRSALKYQVDNNFKTKTVLLFSNSKFDEIPFKKELDLWSKNNNISVFHSLSQEQNKIKDADFSGRVSVAMIKKCADESFLSTAKFWICGPPLMVRAVTAMVEELPYQNTIYTESFTGY